MGFMDRLRSAANQAAEDDKRAREEKKNKGVEDNVDDKVADMDAGITDRSNVAVDDEVARAIMQRNPGSSMAVAQDSMNGSDLFTVDKSRVKQRGANSRVVDFARLDKVAADIAAQRAKENDDDDDGVIDVNKLSKEEKKALKEAMGHTIELYPHLMALKPREGYMFHSDYFDVDDEVATIISYFHSDVAKDSFGAFWGINRIPDDHKLPRGVTVVTLEQIARQPEKWVDEHIAKSEKLDKLNERDNSNGHSAQRRTRKIADDMAWASAEIQDGASYLNVHNRLVLRAPDLASLDEALSQLRQQYIDRFPSVTTAPYHGEQRQEMGNLFAFNKDKHGRGFGYTSTEFAGSYSLVTNGLVDATGEYVGFMQGDVNSSAVMFDVDAYDGHIVCADDTVNTRVHRQKMVDMWGSKVSQACLLNGHRVVHLVLNDAKLDYLGPKMESITSRVDMTNGEINMFEVFGDEEDELSLFPVHLRKIVLMAAQVLRSDNAHSVEDLTVVNGQLREVLKVFYTDLNMWADNAKHNRDRLRLVGIPHDEVPLLKNFQAYLKQRHSQEINKGEKKDDDMSNALARLTSVFGNLLEANGDLFDQITDSRIDTVNDARRVIYEFTGLNRRGPGIAMAQLINVVNFAVESLGEGDTVIVHGAGQIVDEDVQKFLTEQFRRLQERGGRVAYLYESVDEMLETQHFNHYDRAWYTVLGPMSPETVNAYQDQMQQAIPPALNRLITMRNSGLSYVRRGSTNVVFRTDLALGVNQARKQRKEAKRRREEQLRRGVYVRENTDYLDNSARDQEHGGGTQMGDGVFSTEDQAAQKAAQESRDERMGRHIDDTSATDKLAKKNAEEVDSYADNTLCTGKEAVTPGGATARGARSLSSRKARRRLVGEKN